MTSEPKEIFFSRKYMTPCPGRGVRNPGRRRSGGRWWRRGLICLRRFGGENVHDGGGVPRPFDFIDVEEIGEALEQIGA